MEMAIHRMDGYRYTIVDSFGKLLVTVTRQADGKSWQGTKDLISDAVDLAGKIIEDQKLLAEHKGQTS